MKCPYCGINELGTGDINGVCLPCSNRYNLNTFTVSFPPDHRPDTDTRDLEYEQLKADRDRLQEEAKGWKDSALQYEIVAKEWKSKFDTLTARCNELQAEVGRLTRERDAAIKELGDFARKAGHEAGLLTARCKAAEILGKKCGKCAFKKEEPSCGQCPELVEWLTLKKDGNNGI